MNNVQHRHIDFMEIPGELQVYRVWLPSQADHLVGYLLCTTDDSGNTALLWTIWVHAKYRRKGFGRQLVFAAQQHYNEIWTGVSDDDGDKLLYACNFHLQKPLHKKDLPKLVWKPEYGTALDIELEGEVPTSKGGQDAKSGTRQAGPAS
jgi:GNAT superfamily N-acetyltransferase